MNSDRIGAAFNAPAGRRTNHNGFTLMELVVVLATTGLLAMLVLPTLAFSKAKPQAVCCLNNYHQLARAAGMYANDNQQFYPPNPDDANIDPGYNWCAGIVEGWWTLDSDGCEEAGDATYITNSAYSLLAPYLRHSAVPFKCPADWRICLYNGQVVPVVRSVAANGGVGTVDTTYLASGSHSGIPRTPVSGPWLTGDYSHESQTKYATFGSTTAFKNCSPSEIWIYADEDPLSIDDASFGVIAAEPQIVEYPSTRHQNAACFGFCDGHVELHKWQSNLFVLNGYEGEITAPPGPAFGDWFWLAWHATRSFATDTVP